MYLCNLLELTTVPNRMIVAFIRPEGGADGSQQQVGSFGSDTFDRLRELGQGNRWSYEQVDVVWHECDGMQSEVTQVLGVVAEGFDDHLGYLRLPQVERTCSGCVQQAVHSGKGLAGGQALGWERPVGRQAAVETPGQEHGL